MLLNPLKWAVLITSTISVTQALRDDQCILFPQPHHRPSIYTASKLILQNLLGRKDPSSGNAFIIADSTHHYAPPLLLDSKDNEATHIAAHSFVGDIERVTGVKIKVYNDTLPHGTKRAIVVGSVDSTVVKREKPSWTEAMRGRWEVWDARVVPGKENLEEVLVLSGSDRRGTIYAMYTLSQQLGISPLHYWADVPPKHHPILAFDSSRICSHGEPTVKYRGLFINDELPVLWNWARKEFDIWGEEAPFQVGMYEKVYELLLRMTANYMWPAMWASMFAVDGLNPQKNGLPKVPIPGPNQVLANRMGIVMGTSHHEPMTRNKAEWDLEGQGAWDWSNNDTLIKWWEYGAKRAEGLETMYTVGLRGDGDSPLEGRSKELVEHVVDVQQDILKRTHNISNLDNIPQLWVMYKEIQGYYQQGLRIPDNVTPMIADDNWGNIMSTPPFPRNHPAGVGLYYHAEYVGVPRDYKWINTISLAKMREQLNIAETFNVTQVWILNVGDLKLLEVPLDYFLSIAYDSSKWSKTDVTPWITAWAERDFGKEYADEVAQVFGTFSKYISRIKPEFLNATVWSLIDFNEAERLLDEWTTLETQSTNVFNAMPKATRTAYFETVHSVVLLVANLNRMYVAVGKNNLYARQARTSTNYWAKKAVEFFENDRKITQQYHELYDGRWDHMLDQTHINFDWFLEPQRNTMPPVSYIETFLPSRPSREASPPGLPAYYRVTIENNNGAWPGINKDNCGGSWECTEPVLNPLDPFGANRWVEVSSGGPKDVDFRLYPNVSWIRTSLEGGKVRKEGVEDVRFNIDIDWTKVEESEEVYSTGGGVKIVGCDGTNVTVGVPIIVPPRLAHPATKFKGFIEGDGYIAIEAAHYDSISSTSEHQWEELQWYGRTLSGLTIQPSSDKNYTIGTGPSMTYNFFSTGAGTSHYKPTSIRITIQIGPSFNFILDKKLAFGIQLDGLEPRVVTPIPDSVDVEHAGTVPHDWMGIVANEIRNVVLEFEVGKVGVGEHVLTIWGMSAGIVVERVLIDFGVIRGRGTTYLGPPESRRV